MLVKLQRPPPEMRILRPGWPPCSSSATRRPRWPAVAAHMRPAAPAPRTTTSNWRREVTGQIQDSRQGDSSANERRPPGGGRRLLRYAGRRCLKYAHPGAMFALGKPISAASHPGASHAESVAGSLPGGFRRCGSWNAGSTARRRTGQLTRRLIAVKGETSIRSRAFAFHPGNSWRRVVLGHLDLP